SNRHFSVSGKYSARTSQALLLLAIGGVCWGNSDIGKFLKPQSRLGSLFHPCVLGSSPISTNSLPIRSKLSEDLTIFLHVFSIAMRSALLNSSRGKRWSLS